jgi:diketogulonate reductase-like aldo/keto reductase
VQTTKTAIQKGFYHLDCAEMYGTDEEVGIAIKEAGVPREKLFVTNKVSNNIHDICGAVEQGLKKMQLDYFDLCVQFFPCSSIFLINDFSISDTSFTAHTLQNQTPICNRPGRKWSRSKNPAKRAPSV